MVMIYWFTTFITNGSLNIRDQFKLYQTLKIVAQIYVCKIRNVGASGSLASTYMKMKKLAIIKDRMIKDIANADITQLLSELSLFPFPINSLILIKVFS